MIFSPYICERDIVVSNNAFLLNLQAIISLIFLEEIVIV
jgi:hypothetical protein